MQLVSNSTFFKKLNFNVTYAALITGILALSCLLFNSSAYGLSFGEVKLYSYLNEPLDAEVELLGTDSTDSDQISVSLASAQEFARAGLERPFFLSLLRFEVVRAANHTFIKITSKDAIKQPYLDFLIDLAWPGGRLVRGYTLLLDPAPFNSGSVHEKRAMQDPVDASPKVAVLSAGTHHTEAANSSANTYGNASLSASSNNSANVPGVMPYKLAPHSKQQYSKQQFETLFDPDVKEEDHPPIPTMTVVSNNSSERRAPKTTQNSVQSQNGSQAAQVLSPPFSKQSSSKVAQERVSPELEKVQGTANIASAATAANGAASSSIPNLNGTETAATQSAQAAHSNTLNAQRTDLQSVLQSAPGAMPISFNESDVYIRINSKHMLIALSLILLIGGLGLAFWHFLRKRKAQQFSYITNSPYGSNMRSLAETQLANGIGYQSPYSFTAPFNFNPGYPVEAKMEAQFAPHIASSPHGLHSSFNNRFNNQTPQTHAPVNPETDPFAAIDSYLDELLQMKQQHADLHMPAGKPSSSVPSSKPTGSVPFQGHTTPLSGAPFAVAPQSEVKLSGSQLAGTHLSAAKKAPALQAASASSLSATSASPLNLQPAIPTAIPDVISQTHSLSLQTLKQEPEQEPQKEPEQPVSNLEISMEDILSSEFSAEGLALDSGLSDELASETNSNFSFELASEPLPEFSAEVSSELPSLPLEVSPELPPDAPSELPPILSSELLDLASDLIAEQAELSETFQSSMPSETSSQFESFLSQIEKLPQSNEVALKLELAQNYLDMDELDNAMPLLNAVLLEGNEQEREIAQRMLQEYNISSVV